MSRRQMFTRADEERLRAENRRREEERFQHTKMVTQDKLMKANMASDERVEKKRHARRSLVDYYSHVLIVLYIRLQQELQEQEIDEKIAIASHEKYLRDCQMEQERKIAEVRNIESDFF